jgi:chloramphenicol-sensitive protein RarD
MTGACVIWGFSPLFFKALAHVPASEVLAHRTVWALVFFWLLLLAQGRPRAMPQLLRRQPVVVGLAATLISVNWFVFIHSVQVGRAMEASLGYYIFPLVAVLIGAVVFGERLRVLQWAAVGLAVLAVTVLTVGLGVLPFVALLLATTFGTYGMLKKRLDADPLVSVTAETAVIAPIGLAWLWWLHGSDVGFPYDAPTFVLLVLSGPVMTALPLMLFTYATRRVRMATVGLVQYLNPTLQFFCAAVILGEVFTPWHAAAFGLIWAALALYSGQAVVDDRAARRRSISAGTSGTV